MSEREHADSLSLRVTHLIRRARWPDGRPVGFRVDRTAQLLVISNHALHILGIAIALQLFNSLSAWWLLLTIPSGLLMYAAANARLHFAVDRMTRRGIETNLAHVTTLRAKALEHSLRACELSEHKLRMKAESARASDGRRSPERYLERAERERKRATWIRTKIERL